MEKRQDHLLKEIPITVRVSDRVKKYLEKNHTVYQKAQKEMIELLEKNSGVKKILETKEKITVTETEHAAFHRYLMLESEITLIEQDYYFLMGQAMMFSYKNMLSLLEGDILGNDNKVASKFLDIITESRTDELEGQLAEESEKYKQAIADVEREEQILYKMEMSAVLRKQIDRYATAINDRWVLCGDFLYKSGMKDLHSVLYL